MTSLRLNGGTDDAYLLPSAPARGATRRAVNESVGDTCTHISMYKHKDNLETA